jgi:hypothetical protein
MYRLFLCMFLTGCLVLGLANPARTDAKEPPADEKTKLTPKELDALWAELAGADAARAYKAMRKLIEAPQQTVPLLKERLRPVQPVKSEQIDRLITDLGKKDKEAQAKAAAELEKLGRQAEPALRKVLAEPALRKVPEGKPAAERRERIEALLTKMANATLSPERLRAVRSIEVLEQTGTAEARQVLEALAKGAAEAETTIEAKAALERLARRPGGKP